MPGEGRWHRRYATGIIQQFPSLQRKRNVAVEPHVVMKRLKLEAVPFFLSYIRQHTNNIELANLVCNGLPRCRRKHSGFTAGCTHIHRNSRSEVVRSLLESKLTQRKPHIHLD